MPPPTFLGLQTYLCGDVIRSKYTRIQIQSYWSSLPLKSKDLVEQCSVFSTNLTIFGNPLQDPVNLRNPQFISRIREY
uniref:Uncharacterized protein n=1 Tax=Megaselia scalaris TaxID=36166 RepID=T1GZ54_MEGSC